METCKLEQRSPLLSLPRMGFAPFFRRAVIHSMVNFMLSACDGAYHRDVQQTLPCPAFLRSMRSCSIAVVSRNGRTNIVS